MGIYEDFKKFVVWLCGVIIDGEEASALLKHLTGSAIAMSAVHLTTMVIAHTMERSETKSYMEAVDNFLLLFVFTSMALKTLIFFARRTFK